jgi:hypothetical protein
MPEGEILMGMDVCGEAPKNPKGEYFRNNCWYWRPLWNYVFEECGDVLTKRDHESGHYNDGYLIDQLKAERIAAKLRDLCASGKVLDFEATFARHINSLADETCNLCAGTGRRTDMIVQDGCNGCKGKGTRRPSETYYEFIAENVLEFAEFCEASGGFRIS